MRSSGNLLFILSILLVTSCQFPKNKDETSAFKDYKLIYESDQFRISEKNTQFLLEVFQTIKGGSEKENYLLYPQGEIADSASSITHYISYPISSIAISSTTHLGFLESLGMMEQITGASNLDLYYSQAFLNRIENEEVMNIGRAELNEESLIQLSPDVLFAFALTQADLEELKDLRRSGTKVVFINEYLESDPIQKAAWLRFFACFFGTNKLTSAESFLHSIEEQYENIRSLAELSEYKPSAFMGFPWKGSWYVSGKNSYQAHFFKDAAANYIWDEYGNEGSVPLEMELVLNSALEADYWINPGYQQELIGIKAADERFASLSSVKNKKVFSNYKRSNEKGANDYWERGVVRPDLILKDLTAIFHPDLLVDHELYFYKRLDE